MPLNAQWEFDSCLAERMQRRVNERFYGNQAEAARACRMEYIRFHRLLRGSTPDPRGSTILRLAKGLGVSTDWLFGLTSKK